GRTASRPAVESYLARLRLKIHPVKSQLFETRYGANFVGFRVFPEHIRVRNDNLRRARARFKQLQKAYSRDQISFSRLTQSVQSWAAHLKHGDTGRLRQDIFDQLVFTRAPKS
ncbi:MAG: RNA-dependent DNA polymerase, partial [Leptolyngbya sp. SIO4C1]|nr:RNA-dependent DNA polymerase [Leptolyngbya sp. SIO4C1]